MKLLLACLILLASPLQAQVSRNCKIIDCPSGYMPTPAPPSASARQTVATALAAVKNSESDEEIAEKALKDQAQVIKTRLEKDVPWYKPWKIVTDDEIRAATLSDPEYLRLMIKHQSAVAANYAAHNTAILETMKAYNLIPPVTDFTGDPRAAGVNMVAKPWLPRYSRHEKHDDTTGRWKIRSPDDLKTENLENSAVGGGVMAARTRGNGVMEFYGQAFASPEELAVNIFHETSHWVDIAAKPGGFMRSDSPAISFRTEQHAYERAAAFALQIGANAKKHQDLADQFRRQAEVSEKENLTKEQIIRDPRFRLWLGKRWEGSLAMLPAESEISASDEALLQKKMAAAQKEAGAQRRAQEDIAHREHDERLKRTLADLARRACEYPGSVAQSDLDALPLPYSENLAATAVPSAAANCTHVYLYLAGNGRDARAVRTMASPPNLGTPIPQDIPSDSGTQVISFEQMLPRVREFAMSACRSPGQARLDDGLKRPQDGILFLPSDDESARRLEAGLGECERLLFRRMIGVIRFGNPRAITEQWIADRVKEYSPPAPITPPMTSPPAYTPPQQPRCEEFGNKRCP